MLTLVMEEHGLALEVSTGMINTLLITTLKDIAESATADQIKQLDGIARGLCEEVARMEKLRDVTCGLGKHARDEPAARQAAIDAAVAALSDPAFADKEAQGAFLTNEGYKDFVNQNRDKAPGIGEGLEEDDDDVMVGESRAPEKDPLTQGLLVKQNGKFPLKMPCGHVYNVDTVTARSGIGAWKLTVCVVPGCGRPLPDRRDDLKACEKTKHAILKKAKNVGGSASQRQRTLDVEDLDDD